MRDLWLIVACATCWEEKEPALTHARHAACVLCARLSSRLCRGGASCARSKEGRATAKKLQGRMPGHAGATRRHAERTPANVAPQRNRGEHAGHTGRWQKESQRRRHKLEGTRRHAGFVAVGQQFGRRRRRAGSNLLPLRSVALNHPGSPEVTLSHAKSPYATLGHSGKGATRQNTRLGMTHSEANATKGNGEGSTERGPHTWSDAGLVVVRHPSLP